MAKISTYAIDGTPSLSDKVIGTDVSDSNITKNYLLSDIYNLFNSQVSGYVPYVGATNDVDLGSHTITADNFIVNGGTSSGFLKADGSIDTTAYVTISTNQTITGIKTFNNDTIFNDYVELNKFRDYGMKVNYSTDVSTSAGSPTQAGIYIINGGINGYALAVDENTTNVSGGQYPVTIRSTASSGTPAIGMATGIHFAVQDDAGNPAVGQMAFRTTDAVAASYTMRWEMRMKNLGTYQTNFMMLGDGSLALGYNGVAPSYKLDVNGDARLATINQATTDTDKILVSDGGVIKYRTGSEILSDIGAVKSYGSFYDILDQTIVTPSVGQPVLVRNTDATMTSGFSVVSNSRITAANTGKYNIQFSIQLHNNGGGGPGSTVEIWFDKNGVPLPDSNTRVAVGTNSPYVVAAWNYFVPLNAGQYVEIYWATDNANIGIDYSAGSMGGPAIPSAIITINQID